MMRFARTITAFVIALSVAMLPVAGSASIVAKPTEMAASVEKAAGAEMSAAMDDCCPDHAKACDQQGDQCQSMAVCTLQLVSLANVAVSGLKYPALPEISLPILSDQVVPLHSGSPPFRPPRV